MTTPQVIPFTRIPQIAVRVDATLKDGLECLAATGLLICCVVDDHSRMLGIFTDSDARRALLHGKDTSAPLRDIFNGQPVVCFESMSLEEMSRAASVYNVQRIPVLNGKRQIVGLYFESNADASILASATPRGPLKAPSRLMPNPYFILAGGLGTRLRPVVANLPKPLAVVGDRPILQTVIEQAYRSGFNNIFVSVNYMAEMIEEHLADQIYRDMNLKVTVFRESRRLGTAGSLSYLKEHATRSVVVSNADIMTNLDFSRPLDFHEREESDVTILVRRYETKVPYGVVDLDGHTVLGMREKPTQAWTVAAGIYVLSLRALALVEAETFLDMPDLIKLCMRKNMRVQSFLMSDYWLDIGRPDDFLRANQDYQNIFER